MLGAGSLFPIDVTRLRIRSVRPNAGAYPWFPGRVTCRFGPMHDNSTRHWGKSFADDFARTGYCKRQSGLAATIR